MSDKERDLKLAAIRQGLRDLDAWREQKDAEHNIRLSALKSQLDALDPPTETQRALFDEGPGETVAEYRTRKIRALALSYGISEDGAGSVLDLLAPIADKMGVRAEDIHHADVDATIAHLEGVHSGREMTGGSVG